MPAQTVQAVPKPDEEVPAPPREDPLQIEGMLGSEWLYSASLDRLPQAASDLGLAAPDTTQISEISAMLSMAMDEMPGPVVRDGTLIGYRVRDGQGFVQVAADINDPVTQLMHGYTLQGTLDWQDIMLEPINFATYVADEVELGHITAEGLADPNHVAWKSLNMNTGDYLDLSFLPSVKERLTNITITIQLIELLITFLEAEIAPLEENVALREAWSKEVDRLSREVPKSKETSDIVGDAYWKMGLMIADWASQHEVDTVTQPEIERIRGQIEHWRAFQELLRERRDQIQFGTN